MVLPCSCRQLRPSPKWKLVVDVGVGPPPKSADMTEEESQLHHELLILVQRCTPPDKSSPLAPYLPGFTSLRLFLIQQVRSSRDDELLKSILASYASYKKGGHRSEADIASMTARDFMLLSKQSSNDPQRNQSAYTSVVAPRQQRQEPSQFQLVDPVPPIENVFTGMPRATGGAQNGSSGVGHDESSLQHFSTGSQIYGQEFQGSLAISPALHPITSRFLMGSPTNGDHFALLGASPSLHPMTSQQDGVSSLVTLGLSATQISALLQNDAGGNLQGL